MQKHQTRHGTVFKSAFEKFLLKMQETEIDCINHNELYQTKHLLKISESALFWVATNKAENKL